ncbi:MAG: DUF4266 domain-containing protein [Deltaproteobacteria bacterium]|nr:DUF4266 domain-containing protein [Deltaproteobacteria bacterium]
MRLLRTLLACSILLVSGCAKIAAYQRGRLMQRSMQVKPALDAAFEAHVADLRESAIGASGGEGASCGCR